ncbi:MAG: PQQ-binding-like beta-propeller repeat protein [Pirellulales bacterium]
MLPSRYLLIVVSCLVVIGAASCEAAEPQRRQPKPEPQQLATADWPAFRGHDGSGRSAHGTPPTTWGDEQHVRWRAELPGSGSSTPIVVGQRVFVTCYSGYQEPDRPAGSPDDLLLHVACLDRESGEVLWQSSLQPELPEQETIREEHGYASGSPVADGERVYAFFGKSGVVAFDHAGRQLWRMSVGTETHGWGSGASLMLAGGQLIVNASVESQRLIALAPATGQQRWEATEIREAWNTPIATEHGGRSELLVAIFEHLVGLDPSTGRELWRCQTDIPWYMAPSMVAGEGVVYALGGRPGSSLAVRLGGTGEVTSTHRLWTSKKGGNVSSPILHNGHLYWMHDNLGIAYCANAQTGEVVYQERIDGASQVYGSPVLAAGRIYYPSRDGKVFVVAAEPKFRLLATNTLGERAVWNASPAVSGNLLLLRNNRQLYCLGE